MQDKQNEKAIKVTGLSAKVRVLTDPYKQIFYCVAIAWSLFQVYTAAFGVFVTLVQRAAHLMSAGFLVFLLYPLSTKGKVRNRPSILDLAFAGLSIAIGVYVISGFENLMFRAGAPNVPDALLGFGLTLIVLETTRRTVGLAMPLIAVFFLLYAYFGPYFPGLLGHRGVGLQRLFGFMLITTDGIYGLPSGVSATFIYMFLLFGAFLQVSGAGQFFIDLAVAAFGHRRGGPAKAAVLASASMGTLSGSSTANVATTGAFTIPLMKSVGYAPNFAGAVEAVASTGGQIMPPVMGASAFIMAEILGISYIQVCIAAALPAVLYFCTALFTVDLEAAKLGLKGTQGDARGKFTSVLKAGILYVIPILVLIVVLAFSYSPMKAALLGILALIVVSMVKRRTRIGIRKILDALEQGAKIALQVAAVCACAGIIIGVVMVTGLGLNLSSFLIDISGGHLIVVLLLSMIASIILGMGLPTTASYIILAILAAPALMDLGVNPLAAHLFIFYFGCLSQITPPVAVAAYVGAGISGGDAMKTAFQAVRLGITGFFVPYIFVYSPYVVLQIEGYSWLGTTLLVVQTIVTSFCGAYMVAGAVQGWLTKKANIFERVLLFIGGILLLYSGAVSDVIGIGLFVVAFLLQKMKTRTNKLEAETTA